MAKSEHCCYCFDSVLNHLDKNHAILDWGLSSNSNPLSSPSDTSSEGKTSNSVPKFPLFVTWKKRSPKDKSSSPEYRLRGCIGTFSPRELSDGLRDYAITSAFKDHRFSPVKLDEVPFLSCDVSLLVNFEDTAHPEDWTVGVHGIQIRFKAPKSSGGGSEVYSATYLPDVAKEQGWTQKETLRHLVAKAGYDGAVDDKLLAGMRVTRYQSSKSSVTYDAYARARSNNSNAANESHASAGADAGVRK